MRFIAAACLPFAFLFAAAADEAADKEMKKLEGSWVMVSGESKGEKLSDKVIQGARRIVGDRFCKNLIKHFRCNTGAGNRRGVHRRLVRPINNSRESALRRRYFIARRRG